MKYKMAELRDLAEELGIEEEGMRKNELRGAILDKLGFDDSPADETPF